MLGYEGVGALYISRENIERVYPAHTGGRAVVHPVDPDDVQLNAASMDKFLGGSASVPLQTAFLEAATFIEEDWD